MLSQYLPDDFDPTKPIGLVAGRGIYPKLIADEARKAGAQVYLLAYEDETTNELYDSFPEDQRDRFNVGQMGKWMKAMKNYGCKYCIMAGQIRPRKLFKGLKPDLKAATMLLKLKRKNAETIFGAIAKEIENLGILQLDARAFLDQEIASEGLMTQRFEKIDQTYLDHGVEIASEMARLDVGQGVVVRKGTVVAVEAFEGTDPMLRRAGEFKTDQCVFVKTVKHKQDYRFDVPVFGIRTLEVMSEVGLSTVMLKAGSVIILEKEKVLAAANKAKIQIIGF
ncbi:UDP-2,3-diacylglucosamine diphosphatase LpxI [Puniceicoccaceae bacterium K14]|nr:UDP-2,3-diacylglucosamine diphosphatase LpxI [Puniceicoccaceae bacterium K14]